MRSPTAITAAIIQYRLTIMKSNYGNSLAIMENTLQLQSKFARTDWQIWNSTTMRNRQNYEKHFKIAN